MHTFATSLRIIFRRPVFLFIYIVLFGLLGLVVSGAMEGSGKTEVSFTEASPSIAIIDRDLSEVSLGLTDFLTQRGTRVEIVDETRALQDATAQNTAAFILIIPEGYGEDFLSAASDGGDSPELETIVSVEVVSGMLMEAETANFLNALRLGVIASPDLGVDDLISQANQTAGLETPRAVVQSQQEVSSGSLLPFFFKWSAYPITMGVAILIALAFAAFQAGEVRRRNLASPTAPMAMSLQVGASGLVIVVMTWMFICALSLLPMVGGSAILASSPTSMLLFALAALVYSFVPFALGVFCSQLRMGDMAVNGFMNIVGLAMMFMSGIFMGGTHYLSEPMQVLARGVPTYWYADAIDIVTDSTDFSVATLAPYFSNLCIVALFAVAILSIALLIGRLRVQTADAGGNSAADILV